jgi:hypothetical protein
MEKANFVNAEVIKQKQPLKILPSQEQAENTEVAKYWHRWERFLDSYCKPKTNRLYILLATAFGGRGRKCNHTFKPEIIVTNSAEQSFQDLKITNFNERGTNYFTCTDCKERKSYRLESLDCRVTRNSLRQKRPNTELTKTD